MEKVIYPRRLLIFSNIVLLISFLVRIYIPGIVLNAEFPVDFENYTPIIYGFLFAILFSIIISFKLLPPKKIIVIKFFEKKLNRILIFLSFTLLSQLFIIIIFGVVTKFNLNISSNYSVFIVILNFFRNILTLYLIFFSIIKFKNINSKNFIKAISLILLSLSFDLITGERSRVFNWYLLPYLVYILLTFENLKRLYLTFAFFPPLGLIILRFGSFLNNYSTIDAINRINIYIPMMAAKSVDFYEVLKLYPNNNTFFPNSIIGLIPSLLIERPFTNPGNYINEILFPKSENSISFASIGSFGEILINDISNSGLFAFLLWASILSIFIFFIKRFNGPFDFILLSFFLSNNIINQLEDYFAIRFTSFVQFFVTLIIVKSFIEKKLRIY